MGGISSESRSGIPRNGRWDQFGIRTESRTHITSKLESHEVSVSGAVNYVAYEPQHGWSPGDDEPVYRFTNHLTVCGTAIYPPSRSAGFFELTLSGDNSPSFRLNAPLKACIRTWRAIIVSRLLRRARP